MSPLASSPEAYTEPSARVTFTTPGHPPTKWPSAPSSTPQQPSIYQRERLDDDALERFTAIGRPIGSAPPVAAGSSWAASYGSPSGVFTTPTALPMRFTDDSIISVPVRLSDLQDPDHDFDAWWQSVNKESMSRRRGFKAMARSLVFRDKLGARKGDFVLVRMTRGEYLKYCAKDDQGRYIGTEPQDKARSALREMVAREQSGRSASIATVASEGNAAMPYPYKYPNGLQGRRATYA